MGRRHLRPPSKRGIVVFAEHGATCHFVVYAVHHCGNCPGCGWGAAVRGEALTTAQAATAWVCERKVRYPCISAPKLVSATPTAPSIHMKWSTRWRRGHPTRRHYTWITVSPYLLRCCYWVLQPASCGACVGPRLEETVQPAGCGPQGSSSFAWRLAGWFQWGMGWQVVPGRRGPLVLRWLGLAVLMLAFAHGSVLLSTA